MSFTLTTSYIYSCSVALLDVDFYVYYIMLLSMYMYTYLICIWYPYIPVAILTIPVYPLNHASSTLCTTSPHPTPPDGSRSTTACVPTCVCMKVYMCEVVGLQRTTSCLVCLVGSDGVVSPLRWMSMYICILLHGNARCSTGQFFIFLVWTV